MKETVTSESEIPAGNQVAVDSGVATDRIKPMSFDEYLTSRIGFGLYQILALAVCCQIDFVDGSEQYYMMILVQVLQREWNLSTSEVELLGSFFNIGLFFGAITAGILCDLIGRKKALVFGSFLQVITVGLTSLADTFNQILAIRTMYGFVVGITLPIGVLLVMEIVPKHLRGRFVILLTTAYVLGKLYLLFLASIFLEDLTKGNWRAIAICQLIPVIGIILGCVFILVESPRYLISQGKFKEAFAIMDEIGVKNNTSCKNSSSNSINISERSMKYEVMTVREKEALTKWQMIRFASTPSTGEIVKGLFNAKNIAITWRLMLSVSVIYFMGPGLTFILPFFISSASGSSGSSGLWSLFVATIGEIPAQILAFCVIDVQAIGRIRSINFFLVMSLFVYGFVYFTKDAYLVYGLGLIKFVLRFINVCLIPQITESYDTFHRSMGLGISASIGRGLGAFSPIVLYELFLMDKWVIFLLYACLTLVFLSATLTFPVDLTNRPLDEHHGQNNGEGEEVQEEKEQNKSRSVKSEINQISIEERKQESDIGDDDDDDDETGSLIRKELGR